MLTALTLIFATIGLIIWLIHNKNKSAKKYWPKLGIELIEQGNFFIRIFFNKLNFIDAELQIYSQIKDKKYGGVLEIWNPVFYISDLELMKSVYIKDFDHFVNRRGFDMEKNDPHMHLGLFNQSGEAWKSLRSKMSPTFTTGKIRRMFDIFDSSSLKFVKAFGEAAKIEPELMEVRPFLQKFTMDVIASAAFGLQTNMFEDPNSEFAQMGAKIQQQFAGKNLFKFFFISFWPKLGEFLGLKITDGDADKFLSRVIIDSLNHRTKTGEIRNDFLQIMLEARLNKIKKEDEQDLDLHEKNAKLKDGDQVKIEFTNDLIIAQCLLFILGGFDTVESFLVWACYELALNPDVQEKLHDEVETAFKEGNGKFTYDVINRLEYLDMVVSETLRKYPPAFRTERRSTKPYKIPGTDLVLPKESLLAIPIFALQRDPQYWPEPDKFEPMRFTKENVAKRHPCAYQPFGHGPRNCIGNRFALTEGKNLIAHMILNFKLAPTKKTVIPPIFQNGGGLKPIDGMWLKITSRK